MEPRLACVLPLRHRSSLPRLLNFLCMNIPRRKMSEACQIRKNLQSTMLRRLSRSQTMVQNTFSRKRPRSPCLLEVRPAHLAEAALGNAHWKLLSTFTFIIFSLYACGDTKSKLMHNNRRMLDLGCDLDMKRACTHHDTALTDLYYYIVRKGRY